MDYNLLKSKDVPYTKELVKFLEQKGFEVKFGENVLKGHKDYDRLNLVVTGSVINMLRIIVEIMVEANGRKFLKALSKRWFMAWEYIRNSSSLAPRYLSSTIIAGIDNSIFELTLIGMMKDQ